MESQPVAFTSQDDAAGDPVARESDSIHPGRFFVGPRAGINAGNGDPTNDMPYWGGYGRYRVRGPWLVGLAIDQATFDFEEPANKIDVVPDGVVDTTHDATIVTAWGEYEFQIADDGFASRLRPFIGLGLGVGVVSDESVSGDTAGGGTFDIESNGGTEIIPGGLAGIRFDITRNVLIELGARADYHVTSLEVRDNISGNSADVDDYPTFGAYLGLQIRLGE